MVVFIQFYIKFKYLIGDYIGARSAREGGRGEESSWANGGAIPG